MNELRSLQRIATSLDFEAAYSQATAEERSIVNSFIKNGDKDSVQRWLTIQERNRLSIEELTVKELRRLAGSLGIAGYQHMNKASLLSSIQLRNK